jgi:hypothetical protein
MRMINPIASCLILLAFSLHSHAEVKIPEFSDYAVKSYSTKTKLPDFSGRDAQFRVYRTLIREGMTEGPNFAGSFTIISIGCGASCNYRFIGNNRTGEVFEFIRGPRNNNFNLELNYNLDSALIISQWSDGKKCIREYFVFKDSTFDLIKSSEENNRDGWCVDYIEN